jgi:hypothetical protein
MDDTPYFPPETKKLQVPKVLAFGFSGGFLAFPQTISPRMGKQNKKTLLCSSKFLNCVRKSSYWLFLNFLSKISVFLFARSTTVLLY